MHFYIFSFSVPLFHSHFFYSYWLNAKKKNKMCVRLQFSSLIFILNQTQNVKTFSMAFDAFAFLFRSLYVFIFVTLPLPLNLHSLPYAHYTFTLFAISTNVSLLRSTLAHSISISCALDVFKRHSACNSKSKAHSSNGIF